MNKMISIFTNGEQHDTIQDSNGDYASTKGLNDYLTKFG